MRSIVHYFDPAEVQKSYYIDAWEEGYSLHPPPYERVSRRKKIAAAFEQVRALFLSEAKFQVFSLTKVRHSWVTVEVPVKISSSFASG